MQKLKVEAMSKLFFQRVSQSTHSASPSRLNTATSESRFGEMQVVNDSDSDDRSLIVGSNPLDGKLLSR